MFIYELNFNPKYMQSVRGILEKEGIKRPLLGRRVMDNMGKCMFSSLASLSYWEDIFYKQNGFIALSLDIAQIREEK